MTDVRRARDAAARRPMRRAVGVLRARADAIAVLVRLAGAVAARRRGKAHCFGFGISRNKHDILRAEHPGASIVSCRVHKVADAYVKQPAFVGALALRLCRTAAACGLPVAVWGYADRLALGVDLADAGPVERLERAIWGPTADSGAPVFAYVLDRRAPYFDGRRATDLEVAAETLAPADLAAAVAALAPILAGRFQKYAGLAAAPGFDLGPDDLVIAGQSIGDAAWVETDALVDDNVDLVLRAMSEIPARRVFYKAHPFNRTNDADRARLSTVAGLNLLDPAVSFAAIAERRPKVAVVTSGAGLEAALAGCDVHTFGTAFYTHRGFTVDRTACDRRRRRLTAREMLAVTLLAYTRYADRTSQTPLAAAEAVARILDAAAGGSS